jgi:zinc protease
MLVEGTENYPACAFSDLIGSRGASLQASADGISLSLLNDDFEFGIALLDEMVHRASFDPKEIEKVRAQLLIQLKRFWDEPTRFSSQLIKEVIYKDHPNHKNSLGGIESLNAISRDDLIDFYKRSITPQGAVLVIVGNLKDIPVTETVQKILGSWNGPAVEPLSFPVLKKTENLVIEYPIHRDQVVLSIAALSVNRLHPDYEKLIIFNTIFGGGSNCRLYGLRMQSGLFYRIEGSLTMNATEEPGFFWVNTTVSQDRLAQAEREIAHVITTVTDSITQQEFEEAKRAVLSDQINFFKSNKDIARTLLFLKQYDFDWNYYDTRAQRLQQITLQEVKDAVHRILDKTGFITLRVGRCNSEKIDK